MTTTAPAGAQWAKFGDTYYTWAADAAARARPLAVVTQVGRSFQHEHPEVEVLADHGRYLVVAAAEVPAGTDHTCWRSSELVPGAVVFERAEADPEVPDPQVAALLATLSRTDYDAVLARVLAPPTRHSHSTEFVAIATELGEHLTGLGYDVTDEAIVVQGRPSRNVVARKPGTDGAPELVYVTAHLDSINLAGGPQAPAPGADDNGSGTAGVLELARVLAAKAWRNDLVLILFGGEEQGLFGSTAHVAALDERDRNRVRIVVNMDMIARTNTPDRGVLIEAAPESGPLIDELVAAAATYTGLTVSRSLDPFGSDHLPFIAAGLPALLTIEANDRANADVHTSGDVAATLDTGLALDILRMNLAVLVRHLDRKERL